MCSTQHECLCSRSTRNQFQSAGTRYVQHFLLAVHAYSTYNFQNEISRKWILGLNAKLFWLLLQSLHIYNMYNMYVYLNISYMYVLRATFTYFYIVVTCNFCLFSYRQTYVHILFIFETFVIFVCILWPRIKII